MRIIDLSRVFPAETWFGRSLRGVSALVPSSLVLPVLQGPLKRKLWIAGSARSACWLGNYEIDEARFMKQTVRPGSVVFDLGAQAGYHSLHLAMLVGPAGKVYAVEPDERNLIFLQKHVSLNRMSNIAIVAAAVSDFSGISMFDCGINCFSGHLSAQGTKRVKTIQLDQEIQNDRLPVPDYLKIDVEGSEFKVLTGARKTLEESHPDLLIETHQWIPDFASSSEDCRRFLGELDYHVEDLDSFHLYARARARPGSPQS